MGSVDFLARESIIVTATLPQPTVAFNCPSMRFPVAPIDPGIVAWLAASVSIAAVDPAARQSIRTISDRIVPARILAFRRGA